MPILHHNRVEVRDAKGRRSGHVVVYVNDEWNTVSFLALGNVYGRAHQEESSWSLDLPRVTLECSSLSETIALGIAEGKRICLRPVP